MSAAARKQAIPFSQFDQLREAREIIRQEADGLMELSRRIDTRFSEAADLLLQCAGRVIVTGIGKAGLIGQKVTATLSSTGTAAQFLHPAEAVHGDLGCVTGCGVALAFSNSGETEEVCRLLPVFRKLDVRLIAITAASDNTLARNADVVLEIGRLREAGSLQLAPSTTTTAMLALGDALALVVSRRRGFTPDQFNVFHPGGSLGRRLMAVADVMRCGSELRIARQTETIRQVLQRLRSNGRRSGAILIVDDAGALSGIFTDSDLARLLERHREEQLDRPIAEVMTSQPATIPDDARLEDAVELLSQRRISELPVVSSDGHPIGLIDITDVLSLMPRDAG